MALRRKPVAPRTHEAVLGERIEKLEKQIKQLRQAGPTTLQADDMENALNPVPWETIINWPGKHVPASFADPVVYYHPGDLDTETGETEEGWKVIGSAIPVFHIKVFADWQNVRVGDGRFQFLMSEDCDGGFLTKVEAYVTDESNSGGLSIQVRKGSPGGVNMLSTPITIDQGDKHSKDAATQPVVDVLNAEVAWGSHISIDVDASGSNARGLGVVLFL